MIPKKFKAWIEVERRGGDRIIREGKMVQVVSLKANGAITYPYQSDIHGTTRETYPKALLQWIGLNDRNDVEIYEGYIVDPKTYPDEIGVVIYVNHGFRLKAKGSEGFLSDYDEGGWPRDWERMEVIGNIFENPELLK